MIAEPTTKLDQIRTAWRAGDKLGALRIASRFGDRSPETATFKRGMQAHNNAAFYRQLGRDPEAMTAEAFETLARKFKL